MAEAVSTFLIELTYGHKTRPLRNPLKDWTHRFVIGAIHLTHGALAN